jgi:hypothetical protein
MWNTGLELRQQLFFLPLENRDYHVGITEL